MFRLKPFEIYKKMLTYTSRKRLSSYFYCNSHEVNCNSNSCKSTVLNRHCVLPLCENLVKEYFHKKI